MRTALIAAAAASLLASASLAQAQKPASAGEHASALAPDPAAPKGRLSSAAVPKAYRLDFTILPEADGFSGHDEIDVTLKEATRSLYLHGRNLVVGKAAAMVGGQVIPATFTQVDSTGTARLDFTKAVPAGAATLALHRDAQLALTAPFSMARVPVAAIPFGKIDGLPIGIQLVTPWGEDALALNLASRMEQWLRPQR